MTYKSIIELTMKESHLIFRKIFETNGGLSETHLNIRQKKKRKKRIEIAKAITAHGCLMMYV